MLYIKTLFFLEEKKIYQLLMLILKQELNFKNSKVYETDIIFKKEIEWVEGFSIKEKL